MTFLNTQSYREGGQINSFQGRELRKESGNKKAQRKFSQ